ncbi:Baculoviral IAP repeat-containing protein 7-B, partial [Dryobates pubescens]
RLGTFVEFPLDCPVSASALARAGFVYTGEGDKVKCFNCHTTIEGWLPGDSAVERHKNLSPNCKFITETENGSSSSALPCTLDDSSDVEADYLLRTRQVVDMSDSLYPKNPTMCSEESRLNSFHNWPLNSQLTPEELANAGFYYTGNGDHVVCFHCGGGLQEWKENEDPWDQHAKWFPGCSFVRNEKGIEFINNVHLRDGSRDSTVNLSTEEKLRRLQEEKLCKICMAKDISVVLIPCGHLVACKECAEPFDDCPLCRTNIMKKQEVFM